MSIFRKRRLCAIGAVVCAMLTLFCSCIPSYDEEWIIGKTDDEITARYGQFDTWYGNYAPDGTYTGWIAQYTIKEKRVGYLQTYPEETLLIVFDTNSVAINCREVVGRPGN